MQWVSALSTRPSLEAAVNEVVDQAIALWDVTQGERTADLGIFFISSMFASEYPRVLPLLRERLQVPVLVGCGGDGIIGTQGQVTLEVEEDPALALYLAYLPGVEVHSFWIGEEDLPDLDSPPQEWVDRVGVDPQKKPQFILLSDPMASGINDLLQGLDFAYPEAVKVGGLANGGSSRGNGLFCNEQLYDEGTVGVALSGNIVLKAIVAQGCRPIGPILRIEEGDRNVILKVLSDQGDETESEAMTPLEALQDILGELSDEDRELAQHSLFVGLASSELQFTPKRRNFLIRNLLGVDPRLGAIAVGDRVRIGQRFQFHLRDAKASAEDLEALLQQYCLENADAKPLAVLMFSCLGRGESMYEEANFDSQLLHRYIRHIPVSGFFCAGEIGPIGSTTYLHGYTTVLGIAGPPDALSRLS